MSDPITSMADLDDLDLDLDTDGVNEITDSTTIKATDSDGLDLGEDATKSDDLDLGEDSPKIDDLKLDEDIDDLQLDDVVQPPVVDKTIPELNKKQLNLDDEIELDLEINESPLSSIVQPAESQPATQTEAQPIIATVEKQKRTRKTKAVVSGTARTVDYVQECNITSLELSKYKTRFTDRTKERVEELALKIKEQGQIEPIHVFVDNGVSYLLGGFGRVDAILLNGGTTAKAFVYTGLSSSEIYKICSGSNEPRTELTEWDKIVSIGKYVDANPTAPIDDEGNPNSVTKVFVYSRTAIYHYIAAWEFFKIKPVFIEFFKLNGSNISGYVYNILHKVMKDNENLNIADDVWISILSDIMITTTRPHFAADLSDAIKNYAAKLTPTAAINSVLDVPLTPLDKGSEKIIEKAAKGVDMSDIVDLEAEITEEKTTKQIVDSGFDNVLLKLTQAISGMDALIVIDGYSDNKVTEKIIEVKQAIKKCAESAKLL